MSLLLVSSLILRRFFLFVRLDLLYLFLWVFLVLNSFSLGLLDRFFLPLLLLLVVFHWE